MRKTYLSENYGMICLFKLWVHLILNKSTVWGGCVSSNNKIVIVRKSDKENVDVEYVVGQSIVGKAEIDYKSNCGNMTAAVAPFAVEENLISNLSEGNHIVRMYNQNTDKYINVSVPIKNGQFDCFS